MKENRASRSGFILPLPGFIFKPFTSILIAALHIYLSAGHLYRLFSGEILWENVWKGFGALLGAYVFAALATRRFAGLRAARSQYSSSLLNRDSATSP